MSRADRLTGTPTHSIMKALTVILALLTTVAFLPAEADAQYSRRGYEGNRNTGATASNDNRDYAPSRNTRGTYQGDRYRDRDYDRYRDDGRGRLNRRERARYTQRLEARAYDLDEFRFSLERREAVLDGRRVRATNRPSRRDYTRGSILTGRELREWDARLDRREVRLLDREREILRRERRQARRPGSNYNRNQRQGARRGGMCP